MKKRLRNGSGNRQSPHGVTCPRPCAPCWGVGPRPGTSSAGGPGRPAHHAQAPAAAEPDAALDPRALEGIAALRGARARTPLSPHSTSPPRRPLPNSKHKRNCKTVTLRSICGLTSWKCHRLGSDKLMTILNRLEHSYLSKRNATTFKGGFSAQRRVSWVTDTISSQIDTTPVF